MLTRIALSLLLLCSVVLASKVEDELRAQLAQAQKEKAALAAALASTRTGTKALEAGQKAASGERKAAVKTAEEHAVQAQDTADATLDMAAQAAGSSEAAKNAAESARQQNITLLIMQGFGLLGIIATGLITIYGKVVLARIEEHGKGAKEVMERVETKTDGVTTALVEATRKSAERVGHDQGVADAIGFRSPKS